MKIDDKYFIQDLKDLLTFLEKGEVLAMSISVILKDKLPFWSQKGAGNSTELHALRSLLIRNLRQLDAVLDTRIRCNLDDTTPT